MENISLELNFHDITALQAAGLKVPQPAAIQCLPGAIPATGDVVAFAGLDYPGSSERARFQVVSRAHLFGGDRTQRIQLNLQLVVLHQP
jgi:hypothetical protein